MKFSENLKFGFDKIWCIFSVIQHERCIVLFDQPLYMAIKISVYNFVSCPTSPHPPFKNFILISYDKNGYFCLIYKAKTKQTALH